MTDEQVFDAVRIELSKARSRYAFWPTDMIHAAAIASEESGEVVKAVNNRYWQQGDDSWADIQKEAVQAIAMWVRFLAETADPAPDASIDMYTDVLTRHAGQLT
jgi:hypothetical protein